MAKRKLKPGNKVMYSAEFCQSIGAYAGDIPHMRGEIIALRKIGNREFASVQWDDGKGMMTVFVGNLAKKGSAAFSAM